MTWRMRIVLLVVNQTLSALAGLLVLRFTVSLCNEGYIYSLTYVLMYGSVLVTFEPDNVLSLRLVRREAGFTVTSAEGNKNAKAPNSKITL
jgi:hypothetical protein